MHLKHGMIEWGGQSMRLKECMHPYHTESNHQQVKLQQHMRWTDMFGHLYVAPDG